MKDNLEILRERLATYKSRYYSYHRDDLKEAQYYKAVGMLSYAYAIGVLSVDLYEKIFDEIMEW